MIDRSELVDVPSMRDAALAHPARRRALRPRRRASRHRHDLGLVRRTASARRRSRPRRTTPSRTCSTTSTSLRSGCSKRSTTRPRADCSSASRPSPSTVCVSATAVPRFSAFGMADTDAVFGRGQVAHAESIALDAGGPRPRRLRQRPSPAARPASSLRAATRRGRGGGGDSGVAPATPHLVRDECAHRSSRPRGGHRRPRTGAGVAAATAALVSASAKPSCSGAVGRDQHRDADAW